MKSTETELSYRVEVLYWVYKNGRARLKSEYWYECGKEPRALDVAMQFGASVNDSPANIQKFYSIDKITIKREA